MRRQTAPLLVRLLVAVLLFLALAWLVGLVLKVVRWLIILGLALLLGAFVAREARRHG